jgi:hypothetical protein
LRLSAAACRHHYARVERDSPLSAVPRTACPRSGNEDAQRLTTDYTINATAAHTNRDEKPTRVRPGPGVHRRRRPLRASLRENRTRFPRRETLGAPATSHLYPPRICWPRGRNSARLGRHNTSRESQDLRPSAMRVTVCRKASMPDTPGRSRRHSTSARSGEHQTLQHCPTRSIAGAQHAHTHTHTQHTHTPTHTLCKFTAICHDDALPATVAFGFAGSGSVAPFNRTSQSSPHLVVVV